MQTILVVDDDEKVLQTLSIILRMSGYRVLSAEDHREAEREFKDNVVNLVILDHGLMGVTGSELAVKFKAMRAVKVIMLTGSTELLEKPEAVDILLAKPSNVPDLLSAVKGLLLRAA